MGDYRRTLATLQTLTEMFALQLRDAQSATFLDAQSAPRPRGRVEIRCLGRFSLSVDGHLVDLSPSGRSAAILKVLAHRNGRPLAREQLVELLWPGVTADVGANRLRVAMHALRQAVGSDVQLVVFAQGMYRLHDDHVELDVDRFEALVGEGSRLAHAGDTEAARRAFETAERVYRGDYFEDDPFEEWAVVRRQHLRDLYLNVLVKLALIAMERADYDSCVGYGHAIVREDVSSEEAYRLLMLAHARLGNRARALRWYDLCVQVLRRDLDLDPSAATERLRDEIAADEAGGERSLHNQLGLGALA